MKPLTLKQMALAAVLLSVAASAGWAAAVARATVDRKGTLRFSKATLKGLGVSTVGGVVAVELPLPPRKVRHAKAPAPRPKPGELTTVEPYDPPPKLFITLRPDGSLEIRKQRLPATRTIIPGPAGTVFLASGNRGKLVLAKPSGKP